MFSVFAKKKFAALFLGSFQTVTVVVKPAGAFPITLSQVSRCRKAFSWTFAMKKNKILHFGAKIDGKFVD
uniref:Putative secreted protein n=1 Tax=Lutzomyia longipalpis TaxID=7200 RepID=A0A7G3ANC0_LUTLO